MVDPPDPACCHHMTFGMRDSHWSHRGSNKLFSRCIGVFSSCIIPRHLLTTRSHPGLCLWVGTSRRKTRARDTDRPDRWWANIRRRRGYTWILITYRTWVDMPALATDGPPQSSTPYLLIFPLLKTPYPDPSLCV